MIRLVVSEIDERRHDSEMGTTGERKQSLRPISWAECREKKIGIEPKGTAFFLTFPLIGLFRLAGWSQWVDATQARTLSAGVSKAKFIHKA